MSGSVEGVGGTPILKGLFSVEEDQLKGDGRIEPLLESQTRLTRSQHKHISLDSNLFVRSSAIRSMAAQGNAESVAPTNSRPFWRGLCMVSVWI